ncbi:zinc finger MYM-type protein 1-like [Asparagus officinalis]|uniref:zinc finger MYM-type protein 1-like n=1 Tax=Asparagus officinalis TaxID=4686 RepID=UPI00098E3CB0|nr:zinc finger MYM-type protein 1-like [Asparagus officinalis]
MSGQEVRSGFIQACMKSDDDKGAKAILQTGAPLNRRMQLCKHESKKCFGIKGPSSPNSGRRFSIKIAEARPSVRRALAATSIVPDLSVDEDDDNDNEELIEDEGLDENHGDDPSPNENEGNADGDGMNHNENGDTESDEEGLNENLDAVYNDLIEEPSEKVPSNLYDPRVWDSLDDKWRDLLAVKGPDYTLDSPKDRLNKRFTSGLYTRHIHNGETSDRIWLEYCKEIDKAFCFCCKLFKKKPMITQLANEGYNDWSHVGVRLNEHEVSKAYIHNMATWIELQLRLEKDRTIDKSFQDHIIKEKEHWRKLLRMLISIVKYLAKYNLAFRGKNQRIDKENNGNFMGLVQMVAEHDKVVEEHLRRIQNKQIRYHYLSNVIQNELILMISSEIRGAIISRVREAKYFSVILDCTPDISHQEQMTLILRCMDVTVSPVKVDEYFIQFLNEDDTSGLGLFQELQMALTGLGLDIDNVRGQGYDNESNMKGHKQGVQSRLLDINPRAFYTPCACHSLNLTLCDIANCNIKAQDFFGVVQRIYSLFANSTKRWKILMDNLIGVTLKPLSTTRWESRVESIKAIQSQPLQIRQALLQLAENDKDTKIRSEAKSLAKYELEDFVFLLGMTIWYKILVTVNKVSKRLQEKDIPIDVAIELVNGLIISFRKYRETGFAEVMITAKTLAADLGVDPVFSEKQQIFRKKAF